jgi:hypothetical protein
MQSRRQWTSHMKRWVRWRLLQSIGLMLATKAAAASDACPQRHLQKLTTTVERESTEVAPMRRVMRPQTPCVR